MTEMIGSRRNDQDEERRRQGAHRPPGGFRESAESWGICCATCCRRGMKDPILAGRGRSAGFWRALAEGCPPRARATLHRAQDTQCALRAAEIPASLGQEDASRDLGRRGQGSRQGRWRRITAPELIPLVRADVEFKKGTLLEGSDQNTHAHDAAHPVDPEPGDQQRTA